MELNSLAKALSAFAHPVRLQVLRELGEEAGGLSAGDLARRIAVRQNTLSAHMSALEQQGLVFGHRHGRHIIYRMDATMVKNVLNRIQSLASIT
jgi:DNA-binding transcriptional ArsR family regulator